MTNASMKNLFVALSVLAVAATLSLGVFATTVHAQEDWGYDYGGSSGGYDWGYDYSPSYDTGSYDWGYDYSPSYDTSSYDWGYDYGTGGTNFAPDAYTNFSPDGYTNFSPDCGSTCYTNFAPDAYTNFAPDYCNCDTPSYTYDSYDYYDTYTPSYSYGGGYSYTPSYSTPSYSSSRPTTFYAPGYSTPSRTTQTTSTSQPVNIVNNNTNNNNNVNNNTNNVNVNVASVSPATSQTQVQYVYPQVQSYPVYLPTYYSGYNYNNYQYQQQPYCTITATNGANGLVTLYWSSSYTTSAYISPSVGSVAPNGSTSLYTYGTTNYTMTVSGPGGSNTCRTNYIAIATPSVSLSQIPYTGFDFGPVGNAIYWMSLLAFAVAGAYLLVYYKGGALAFASQMIGTRTAVSVQEIETPIAAPLAGQAVEQKEEQKNIFASLPVMQSSATKDTMSMARTSDGTPRIVINRG